MIKKIIFFQLLLTFNLNYTMEYQKELIENNLCKDYEQSAEIKKTENPLWKKLSGNQLLHQAVKYNKLGLLKELVLQSKSIRKEGNTPLFLAKTSQALDILLEHPDCLKDKKEADKILKSCIYKDICTERLLDHNYIEIYKVENNSCRAPLITDCFGSCCANSIKVLLKKYGYKIFGYCGHEPSELLLLINFDDHPDKEKEKQTIDFLEDLENRINNFRLDSPKNLTFHPEYKSLRLAKTPEEVDQLLECSDCIQNREEGDQVLQYCIFEDICTKKLLDNKYIDVTHYIAEDGSKKPYNYESNPIGACIVHCKFNSLKAFWEKYGYKIFKDGYGYLQPSEFLALVNVWNQPDTYKKKKTIDFLKKAIEATTVIIANDLSVDQEVRILSSISSAFK